jgi:hypothetical protein
LPAAPAEFENVAVNVALAPGAKLLSVVPAGKVNAPSPPREAFNRVNSPIGTFPPLVNVTFTTYVPVPVVIAVGFVAAGPILITGMVDDGFTVSVTVIGSSIVGIATVDGGGGSVMLMFEPTS